MNDAILIGLELTGVFPARIAIDIGNERGRQEHLRASGKFKATCATVGADAMNGHECFTVLGEEVGEVARALIESHANGDADAGLVTSGHLREELIQVAAVCVAWLSRIDGVGVP